MTRPRLFRWLTFAIVDQARFSRPVKSLADCHLYGIVDLSYVAPTEIERVTEAMCLGGCDILQLRAKQHSEAEIESFARRIAPLCSAVGVPFILNDFPELVPSIGASGAHVGQDDRMVADARWRAGRSLAGEVPSPIIGKSTHSLTQAIAAAEEGADYIGFGPLFPTPTKANRPAIGLADIRHVEESVRVPIFCIGGIKRENLDAVLAAGARRVVIVSGILQARDIAGYCREVNGRLEANCA
jgi:thiamine-phosphate pyrophosphorylase